MTPDLWFYAFAGYFFLFAIGVGGFAVWRRKRSQLRAPLPFKLLRGPGESLRKRMARSDENTPLRLMGAACVPLLVLIMALRMVVWFQPRTPAQFYTGVGVAGVLFCLAVMVAGRWLVRDLVRYANDHLGYLGEREVAEWLAPLAEKGYRIFHDVPAEKAGKTFNLDHVVVGPGGLAVVEVKTRRKGRARPGFRDHVVTYDGTQLIWPWGEDRHGLSQTLAEAAWLKEWIHVRTGLDVSVLPLLVLPGWWVERKAIGDVRVLNAKEVASAVEGRGVVQLTPEQIDLIARQLDVACRDVED